MYGVPGGEIPSVGKVEMAWVSTPLPPVNISTPIKSDDSAMDEGDAMAPAPTLVHADPKRETMENLDYDVADDNDWGVQ